MNSAEEFANLWLASFSEEQMKILAKDVAARVTSVQVLATAIFTPPPPYKPGPLVTQVQVNYTISNPSLNGLTADPGGDGDADQVSGYITINAIAKLEGELDAKEREIEDKWHRRWHRDTGIPCDGSKECCPKRTIADCSPGDVISATPDGTIVLDDGITTWNPARATAFIVAEKVAEAKREIGKSLKNILINNWNRCENEKVKQCANQLEYTLKLPHVGAW